MLSVAGIISVVVFIVVTFSCYKNGLFSTLVTLFVLVISGATATALMMPLSKIPLFGALAWYTPPICFLGTFLLCLVILQTLASFLYPPRLTVPKPVDVMGGAVLGLLNAYFLTGVLMTGLGLFPGTGEAEDKVAFLRADAFFARSMALLSEHTGSVALNADEFLHNVRKEKWDYRVRDQEQEVIRQESTDCAIRIYRLGTALKKFIKANGGSYPESLEDIVPYLDIQGARTPQAIEECLICPTTHFRYKLFPVRDYREVEGDNNFVLLWDAVGDDPDPDGLQAAHRGDQQGKRPAFFPDSIVRWVTEGNLRALLAAQKNAMRKDE
jgi:hypothetical protein